MIARVVGAHVLLLLKKLLNQTWRLIMKHGDQRVVCLFCYICLHKLCILPKSMIKLQRKIKRLEKEKVKVSRPLVTNFKNLVALATSESQF